MFLFHCRKVLLWDLIKGRFLSIIFLIVSSTILIFLISCVINLDYQTFRIDYFLEILWRLGITFALLVIVASFLSLMYFLFGSQISIFTNSVSIVIFSITSLMVLSDNFADFMVNNWYLGGILPIIAVIILGISFLLSLKFYQKREIKAIYNFQEDLNIYEQARALFTEEALLKKYLIIKKANNLIRMLFFVSFMILLIIKKQVNIVIIGLPVMLFSCEMVKVIAHLWQMHILTNQYQLLDDPLQLALHNLKRKHMRFQRNVNMAEIMIFITFIFLWVLVFKMTNNHTYTTIFILLLIITFAIIGYGNYKKYAKYRLQMLDIEESWNFKEKKRKI